MGRRQERVGAFVLAFVLALGALLAWAAACLVIGSVVSSFRRSDWSYTTLVVRADGTPLLLRRTEDERTYFTLDGETVDDREVLSLRGATLVGAKDQEDRLRQLQWSRRIQGKNDGRKPSAHWYLVLTGVGRLDDRAYLVGFDSVSKRCIGYLGKHGFRPDPVPEAEQFRLDGGRFTYGGNWYDVEYAYIIAREPRDAANYVRPFPGFVSPMKIHLAGENRVFEVDVRERSVRLLCEAPGVLSVGVVDQSATAEEFRDRDRIPKQWQLIALRLPDQIWLVHPESGEHRAFTLPADLRDDWMTVYAIEDGLLLQTREGPPFVNPEHKLTWLDAGGRVVRQRTAMLPGDQPTPFHAWQGVLCAPAPFLVELFVHVVEPSDRVGTGAAATFQEGWKQSSGTNWPLDVANIVCALALAWWCQRRHRQLGLPLAKAWFVFVLLLGPPGLIGYLLHRRWPVREACPGCGRIVPRDRDACFACSQPFPPPPVSGSEVFA
jgi:hypothetical protein